MKARAALFVTILALSGCTTEQTKTSVSQERGYVQIRAKAEKPLDVQGETTVLDTRASFTYGLNHIRNSLYFPWTNLAEDGRKGDVIRDAHQAALRLSLLGLMPQSPVLVVGDGVHGAGEEGRLAWTLIYFGFQDVQVASVEALRPTMTQDPSAPAKNVAPANLIARTGLQISPPEFKRLAKDPKLRAAEKTILIDVRSAEEFAKAPANFALLNLDWKSFYTAQGRPDFHLKRKLAATGIESDWQIILISNRGVRSAAAAYALLALGYSHVQNFTAGWNALRD